MKIVLWEIARRLHPSQVKIPNEIIVYHQKNAIADAHCIKTLDEALPVYQQHIHQYYMDEKQTEISFLFSKKPTKKIEFIETLQNKVATLSSARSEKIALFAWFGIITKMKDSVLFTQHQEDERISTQALELMESYVLNAGRAILSKEPKPR